MLFSGANSGEAVLISYQHPNFQHFDQNSLNCKYCKNVSSISFNERIFAQQTPCAKPERSEVVSQLAPRGFECSFKAEAVVNSSPDHRDEAQGLPLLLGYVAAAPAQLLPAKHTFSLQRYPQNKVEVSAV